MSYIQRNGQVRSPVTTYATLPITGNVQNDIRITTDVGTAYTWNIAGSSGSLSDWKKLTISNYNDLTTRPSATVLDINNATEMVPNLTVNQLVLGGILLSAQGSTITHYSDGAYDRYATEDGIASYTNMLHGSWLVNFPTIGAGRFMQPTRGTKPLDIQTRSLIHADTISNRRVGVGATTDLQLHDIGPYDTVHYPTLDTGIKKFGVGSFAFNGTNQAWSMEGDSARFFVLNKDFSYDFWVYPKSTGLQGLIVDQNDFGLSIVKNASEKLAASLKTTVYTNDTAGSVTTITATSTSSLALNTWTHVAVQRRGGYLEVYINGTLEATSVSASNDTMYVGTNQGTTAYEVFRNTNIGVDNTSHFFNGNMDEIRCSVDVTRYTGSFTPETVAYNTAASETTATLQSTLFTANRVPSSARFVIGFIEDQVTVINPNIDIEVFVSRDGGTTWTTVVLGRYDNIVLTGVNFFTGIADLSSQPVGKEMVYKYRLNNNKDINLSGAGLLWK